MKLQQITRSVYIPLLIASLFFSRPMFCSFSGSAAAFFLAGAGLGLGGVYYGLWKPLSAAAKEVNETTVKVEALHVKVDNLEKEQAQRFDRVDAYCASMSNDLAALKQVTEEGITKLQQGQKELKAGQENIKTLINETAKRQEQELSRANATLSAVQEDTSDMRQKMSAQSSQGQTSVPPAQNSQEKTSGTLAQKSISKGTREYKPLYPTTKSESA